jgi:ABC-type uncharacterized transport system involved in gliding motility auxiliary subunit
MKLSQRIHQQIRLKNAVVTLMLISLLGSLAWLSYQYPVQIDITGNDSNTLSFASQKVLTSLPEPVQITAFIKKGHPLRAQIGQLVNRYQRHKANLQFVFIDPDSAPAKTRELNIGAEGLILVDYQGRTEKLSFIDESSLTNALLQLANAEQRWVTFLIGHGERSPETAANFDVSEFGKELKRRKINAQALNLAVMPAIPDNSALLVISTPAVPLLAGEIAVIKRYIQQGGNLLILTDPDNKNLTGLLQNVGIQQLDGVIVDNNAKLYGVNDPSFVLANDYVEHPVTHGFKILTLFPVAAALEIKNGSDYQAEALISSAKLSWTETGEIKGAIKFADNANEKQGPHALAVALTRKFQGKAQQRIMVVGDGDFLSNAYIGNVGNLDMGLRMVNWLIHDDRFIDIPAKIATDKSLQLTPVAIAIMGFGFLIGLPLAFITCGFFIWQRRKRR